MIPYEVGAAGMPYSTQADYLPIPPGAMGTLFDPKRIEKGHVTQPESRAIYVVAYIDVREQPARRNADPGTPRPSVSRDAAPTKLLLC
jgi:hypothetical protein